MKLLKKVLAGVAVAAAMATSAHAALNNVGGVVWDPNAGSDFSGVNAQLRQFVSPTGVVSGFGIVTSLNNTLGSTFCPGCELTVSFYGFTPSGPFFGPIPINGEFIGFQGYSGGTVEFWVDHTPNSAGGTSAVASNYNDGQLWASFTGGFTGQINFTQASAGGSGQLDITSGLAFTSLNTNTVGNGHDLSFSNTFTNVPNFGFLTDLNPSNDYLALNNILGGGTFTGDSVQVPEPTSIALMGLGLVGLAAARRRKQAK